MLPTKYHIDLNITDHSFRILDARIKHDQLFDSLRHVEVENVIIRYLNKVLSLKLGLIEVKIVVIIRL